jgi:GT2 family glycosyltransferase
MVSSGGLVTGMTSSTYKVTVVIPNWNGRHWLEGCLEALKVQDFHDFGIVIVDDASTDDSVEYVEKEFPGVKVIRQHQRRGFAKSANAGITAASGDYVLLLNNDTIPAVSFIRNLVNSMDSMPPEVGSLASCMLCMDNPTLIDDTGDILTWYGQALKRGHGKPATDFTENCEVFSACAGAALYRRSFLNETGGFDEKFVNYLEDVDLGFRGRISGYRCWFVAGAEVMHKGHGSNISKNNYVRYITRNRLLLIGKNIPLSLVFRHLHHLMLGQIALFIQYKRPIDSIIGYITFFPLIPHMLRKKHRITSKRTIENKEIEQLLLLSHEGISLPEWLSVKKPGDPK